jgi:opacity protein-like surface antigen
MRRMTMLGALLLLTASLAAASDVYHRGYTRHDGTYVAPHYQTAPDRRLDNNYSTQGNLNPHTGQWGTKPAYPTTPSWGSGQRGWR